MTIAKWTPTCPRCKNVFTHELEVTENFENSFKTKSDNIHIMTICPQCGEDIELSNAPIIKYYPF